MGRNAYCMRFRPVPSEGESFMASKQKILIVDDDNNIAELISLYLTKECYDTKIVNDGEEAVREFHSFQPNLILLDLMLPGMDGYQVCREIRHDSDVPMNRNRFFQVHMYQFHKITSLSSVFNTSLFTFPTIRSIFAYCFSVTVKSCTKPSSGLFL